jgi:opacity protein-like surface antigen
MESDLLTQTSKAYELQLDCIFYNWGSLSLHASAGIANWHSSLEQQFWLQVTPTFIWGDKTVERTSGYTPKIGVGLKYRLNDQMSVGLQYDYYRRLCNGKEMIDRYSLLIGDLVMAATGHEPLAFRLDTFELTFGYHF